MRGAGARATAGISLLLTALLVWPYIPHVPYDLLNTAITACEYCIVALSLVLLIGLVGQISLCQGALVGMGAFTAALCTQRLGVHFPLTLVVATLAGTVSAAVIGTVALRVRGLYLAVATLIFAYVCDQYLFTQPWLVGSESGTSIAGESVGTPGTIPFFDLSDAHIYYYVALAIAAFSLYTVANLRDSRIGRAFAAIRGSEVAAASLGIDVSRVKLLGFACAGALAGLGGGVFLVGQRTIAPQDFDFSNSLYYLTIAVVGGLRSLGGTIVSALMFALLVGEVFLHAPSLSNYRDLISSGLLIAVLLFFRGGLGAVPARVSALWQQRVRPRLEMLAAAREERAARRAETRRVRLRWAMAVAESRAVHALRGVVQRRRAPDATAAESAAAPIDVVGLVDRIAPEPEPATITQLTVHPPSTAPGTMDSDSIRELLSLAVAAGEIAGEKAEDGRRQPVLLAAEGITVRFGGLTAVNNAWLQVGAGEIVGLIGPNGAGKTTLFNSILGLNTPAEGHVQLYGEDVTEWPVHRRAELGVGRTFQILQLFSDLTVFDNLLVATHLQNRTGLWGSLFVTPRARRREKAARARVHAVLRLMDLERFADRNVAGLPFGVLRLIEVARTLVTGARLVCFDEPASGLDSTETEGLIEWFQLLRQIGITVLVIEHDVPMVLRLCDYIYVLDQGSLIAEGTPLEVQRNQAVVDAYLGQQEEVA